VSIYRSTGKKFFNRSARGADTIAALSLNKLLLEKGQISNLSPISAVLAAYKPGDHSRLSPSEHVLMHHNEATI
jgi:hypothetical protein